MYFFIHNTPRSTLTRNGRTGNGTTAMCQIELFNHLQRIIIIIIIIHYWKLYSYVQTIHIRKEYLMNRIIGVR